MKSKAIKSLAALFLAVALTFTTGVAAFAANNYTWNVGESKENNVVAYIKDHTLYIEGNGRMDSYARVINKSVCSEAFVPRYGPIF